MSVWVELRQRCKWIDVSLLSWTMCWRCGDLSYGEIQYSITFLVTGTEALLIILEGELTWLFQSPDLVLKDADLVEFKGTCIPTTSAFLQFKVPTFKVATLSLVLVFMIFLISWVLTAGFMTCHVYVYVYVYVCVYVYAYVYVYVEFKFLAWYSIAQSVCQLAFSLLAIWCLRPRVQNLHSAEEDNLSPFDLNIACLCQSIEINNNKYVYIYDISTALWLMFLTCIFSHFIFWVDFRYCMFLVLPFYSLMFFYTIFNVVFILIICMFALFYMSVYCQKWRK